MLQIETIRDQIAHRRLRADVATADSTYGLALSHPVSRRTFLVASAAGSAALPLVAEAAAVPRGALADTAVLLQVGISG